MNVLDDFGPKVLVLNFFSLKFHCLFWIFEKDTCSSGPNKHQFWIIGKVSLLRQKAIGVFQTFLRALINVALEMYRRMTCFFSPAPGGQRRKRMRLYAHHRAKLLRVISIARKFGQKVFRRGRRIDALSSPSPFHPFRVLNCFSLPAPPLPASFGIEEVVRLSLYFKLTPG